MNIGAVFKMFTPIKMFNIGKIVYGVLMSK